MTEQSGPKRPPTFTIGNTKIFLEGLAECQSKGIVLLKKGAHCDDESEESHPGGIVFQTPMDARRYINSMPEGTRMLYSVFELDADWEHDCYEQTNLFEEYYWRNLMIDRPILYLVEDA